MLCVLLSNLVVTWGFLDRILWLLARDRKDPNTGMVHPISWGYVRQHCRLTPYPIQSICGCIDSGTGHVFVEFYIPCIVLPESNCLSLIKLAAAILEVLV